MVLLSIVSHGSDEKGVVFASVASSSTLPVTGSFGRDMLARAKASIGEIADMALDAINNSKAISRQVVFALGTLILPIVVLVAIVMYAVDVLQSGRPLSMHVISPLLRQNQR